MSAQVPVHVPERCRFEVSEPAGTAVLTYTLQAGEVVLEHTVVPNELEGAGVGGALLRCALAWAVQQDRVVVPQCSFVRGWLDRHDGELPVRVRRP